MIRQKMIAFLLLLSISAVAQSEPDDPAPHLLGNIERAALLEAEWYNNQYNYTPNQEIIAQLKEEALEQYRVQIFFGSWCGDSRRELPRFLKILDELNISAEKVEMIGVATGEHYKQSPDREEIGKAIYRVPTFIIYKGNVEQGRIVEYPVLSLERDLLLIIHGKEYTPNYYSFPFLSQWQKEGILKDKNIDGLALANQIRGKVFSPSELNSVGYVLLYSGEQEEAKKVFRINTFLFPEVASAFDTLAGAFKAAKQNDNAILPYEIAQKIEPENEQVKEKLATLKEVSEFAQKTADQSLEANEGLSEEGLPENHLQEKLFLHIDRPSYLAGETMWFKINIVSGRNHKPLDLSEVVYVELLSNGTAPPIQVKIAVSKGFGNGAVYLPLALKSGKYKVRAYTNWMKNFGSEHFFAQEISIFNTIYNSENIVSTRDSSLNIQFFPEGGQLINGIKSKVAFRVVDNSGKGIDFKGAIVNDRNDTITLFKPSTFGIGYFYYTPEEGVDIKTIIQTKTDSIISNAMPTPINNGYVIHLEDAREKELLVSVAADVDFSRNVSLVVHSNRGSSIIVEKRMIDGKVNFAIERDNLEEGVSRITLYDYENKPLAERLYFKYPASKLKINTSIEDETLYHREKVTLNVAVEADGIDSLLKSNLSLAVYQIDSLNLNTSENIFHYLWLSSELKGEIESPAYYFDDVSEQTIQDMDNVMLTHGWRKFKLTNRVVKQDAYSFIPEYEGLTIKGKVDNPAAMDSRRIRFYLATTGKMAQLYGSKTDGKGNFYFVTKGLYGNQKLVIQASSSKNDKIRFSLENPFFDDDLDDTWGPFYLNPNYERSIISRHIHMQTQNVYWNSENNIILASAIDSTNFYDRIDHTYVLDNYTRFPTMEEVMREYVPEVLVRKQGDMFNFRVIRMPQKIFTDNPLVLINNIPVFDINKIIEYNPLLVKQIDIIKDGFILGGKSVVQGIINYRTYTNSLEDVHLDPSTTVVNYEGLQVPRVFYSPMHGDKMSKNSPKPDHRNLLFWDPSVTIHGTGTKEIAFYTSDLSGKYIGIVQGLNDNGNAGYSKFSFEVRDRMMSKK